MEAIIEALRAAGVRRVCREEWTSTRTNRRIGGFQIPPLHSNVMLNVGGTAA